MVPGYRCPNRAQDPIPCVDGTYNTAASDTCTECPAGSACPTADAAPIPCAAGESILSRSILLFQIGQI